MGDTYIAWNGKAYPSPPPDGWHKAADGRWWAAGTGPKEARPEAATDVAFPQPTSGDSSQQTVLPDDVSVPPISRSPERTGTWPRAQTPNELVKQEPAPKERRRSRQEVEAMRAQAEAEATSSASDETILPGNALRPAFPPPVDDTVPQAIAPFTSTDADGEPYTPAPPDPNARPKAIAQVEKSNVPLLLGGGLALLLVGAGLFWFFALRGNDDIETTTDTSTTTTEPTTTSQPSTTSTSETTKETTTTAPSTSVEQTTTTELPEVVSPSSATIPRAEVVSGFREKLASNGLSSEVLTDDEIVKFGEDFCFIASNSKDRAAFETEAETAIDDSSSELSDDELRLIIDTAVVVSCPEQAERLDISI